MTVKRTHCKWCGDTLPKGRPKFCSTSCQREYYRHTRVRKIGNIDWKNQIYVCKYCKEEYEPKHALDEYCSSSCKSRARKDKYKWTR